MVRSVTLAASIAILILVGTACSLFGSGNGVVPMTPVSTESATSLTTQEEVDLVHTMPTVSLVADSGDRLASSSDLQASLIQVYRDANPSVVYIITASGSGSGFVYSQDGMIVTNNHVVAGTRSFEVVFANGERQRASLVGTDADGDLAVIQVEQLPEGAAPLSLAEADSLQVGQFVVAIGNPFGEQGSMSLGIVSALGRSLPSQRELSVGSTYSLPEVIQTDAPINPGNSGGPLLNLDGQVVGVNSAIASQTGTNSGVGFSIPVSAVRLVVPSLIKDGKYEYPYMGAGFDPEISLDEEAQFGLRQTQGAYVLNVTPGSPAEQAGLVAANPNTGRDGDLIIALDGQLVQNFSDLNSYLVFHTSIGQTIEITLLRGGEQVALQLTLGARP
ncbi:MAG TPA: trypsin-like peptidase domain-containing protein [Anaerolineales bacterium]|nr:trypsin-like peptidase domain-containing protein [Anaerolineales bacterium]